MYKIDNSEARPRRRCLVASIAGGLLGTAVLCQSSSAGAQPALPGGGLPSLPSGGLPGLPRGGLPTLPSRGLPSLGSQGGGFPAADLAGSPEAVPTAVDLMPASSLDLAVRDFRVPVPAGNMLKAPVPAGNMLKAPVPAGNTLKAPGSAGNMLKAGAPAGSTVPAMAVVGTGTAMALGVPGTAMDAPAGGSGSSPVTPPAALTRPTNLPALRCRTIARIRQVFIRT
jgi:hypothetical protein